MLAGQFGSRCSTAIHLSTPLTHAASQRDETTDPSIHPPVRESVHRYYTSTTSARARVAVARSLHHAPRGRSHFVRSSRDSGRDRDCAR